MGGAETIPKSEHGIFSSYPAKEALFALVAPSTSNEVNTIKQSLDVVACALLPDQHFEFDSSIVKPDVAEGIIRLQKLRSAHPGSPITLFGHADPVGDDGYNKTLSGRRVRAIYALLTREPSIWKALFDNPVGNDKWGNRSIQIMLIALGHDTGRADGVMDDKSKEAVKAFQKKNSLKEDGDPGPKTREKLFPAYMDKLLGSGMAPLDKEKDFLARGADADGKGDYQGCSEFNPILMFSKEENEKFKKSADKSDRNKENAPNRRVLAFFFKSGTTVDPQHWPCPKSKDGVDGCKERFFSDAADRRSFQEKRRTQDKDHDTFACRFYDRIANGSPCEMPTPGTIPPTISLAKIQTSVPAKPPLETVFFDTNDFSPRLGEHAKVHVKITDLLPTFTGKVRVDFGRLTNRANKKSTPDMNESFTLVARVEKNIVGGTDPLVVEVEWDGLATADVPQELSDRKTVNVNTAKDVNIPLEAIKKGDPISHGLYFIDEISLLDSGGTRVAKQRPTDVDLSVPILVNLQFNAKWPGDLQAFGLTPFGSDIEAALEQFGGRDYMIRSATRTDRINARYIRDNSITNGQSIRLSIGGPDPAGKGLFGSTPDGPAPLSDNLYAIKDAIGADIVIYPSTFMTFNTVAGAIGPADQPTFRAKFGTLGVGVGATVAAPGTASARSVAGGVVSGACDNTDASNITLTFDDDGMATVVSKDTTKVPLTRARAIQAALRAFVRMVGNTINHEVAHALGVVSRVRASNRLTISGQTLTSPLDGDGGAHNKVTNTTNIVDSGGTRNFVRRIEETGILQKFSPINMKYLRDCLPFDRNDN